MIETKSKDIGAVKYECSQFPGRHGVRLQARLMRIMGPLLGSAVALADGKKADADASGATIARAFSGLAEIDPKEYEDLTTTLLALTKRDGQLLEPAVIDTVYAGNYGEFYKALAFVLDTNFSSLFGASGITGLTAKLTEMAKKKFLDSSPKS